ncbi:hypothetical protein B0H13DRAFT_1887483 [Mycena leptocephala]|nr:hypothetical protein B0H13DRAFT_1887483 [Mycena leptocephala]
MPPSAIPLRWEILYKAEDSSNPDIPMFVTCAEVEGDSSGFYSVTGDRVRELGLDGFWSCLYSLGYFLKPAFLSGTVPCNATYRTRPPRRIKEPSPQHVVQPSHLISALNGFDITVI